MQRQQQGFTLIELVIVIVILGILSAFALPRFADLGSDARIAVLEGAEGAIKSSAAIVRSKCLADSDCDANASTTGSAPETIVLEGQTIELALGYPEARKQGILRAAQLETDFAASGGADGASATITIRPAEVDSGDKCFIEYTSADTSSSGTVVPPETTVEVSDC